MAKRDETTPAAPVDETPVVPAAPTPPAPEPAPDADQPYRLGQWQTYTTYNCRFCAWDTVDDPPRTPGEFLFYEHYAKRHVAPVAPPQPSIVLTDRFGNILPQ